MSDRLNITLSMCLGILIGGLCADLEGVSWQVALFVSLVLLAGLIVYEFINALK